MSSSETSWTGCELSLLLGGSSLTSVCMRQTSRWPSTWGLLPNQVLLDLTNPAVDAISASELFADKASMLELPRQSEMIPRQMKVISEYGKRRGILTVLAC